MPKRSPFFMQYIKSTYAILAFYALNMPADDFWVVWALDMITAGFETDHLFILAGESGLYNQFYMRDLTAKVFAELSLDVSSRDIAFNDYALWLVEEALAGNIGYWEALTKLKNLYQELDHVSALSSFYLLYWAHDDFRYGDAQWYWEGATKENIGAITRGYFQDWVKGHAYGSTL